jgi:hypothetical protein
MPGARSCPWQPSSLQGRWRSLPLTTLGSAPDTRDVTARQPPTETADGEEAQVTKLIIHIDTAREHAAFIADLEAAGCEIELYDDLDYVSRPELRAALDESVLAGADPDELD